jgi:hypothetical protein
MCEAPVFRFLTPHGNALLLIMRDPKIHIREVADHLDIGERAAKEIVADLSKAGYLELDKVGGRDIYSITTDLPLHLAFQRDLEIKALLGLLQEHHIPIASSQGKQLGSI